MIPLVILFKNLIYQFIIKKIINEEICNLVKVFQSIFKFNS